jgi:deoxyadenosine/deoxycytidine kinase
MKKIGISGVPGAGKTSLARALSSECRHTAKFKNVEIVSEYARRYISKHGSIDHVWEQYRVTEKQIEWEQSISEETDLLVTDSPIYLGFFYAKSLVNFKEPKEVMFYTDLFKRLIKLNNRYDLIIHLDPVLDPVKDGVRRELHFDPKWRSESNISILTIYSIFGQDKIEIISEKEMDKRVKICFKLFEKYGI